MKIFGKTKLRRLAAVAAVGGALFFGGNAQVSAAPMDNDTWAFREAYTSQTADTRVFAQDLTLIAPTFHLDIDSRAQILTDGSFRMGGNFTWTYTNLKKNYSTNSTIPFYIEQIGNEMRLYVQRRGKWSKMFLPGLPSGIAILWKTTDSAILNETMDAVKNVEVLKDTSDLRIMNVTLDGAKLATILEKNSQSTFANLKGDALSEQKEMFDRWLAAFKTTDITFAWTVNKPSWKTASAAFDLTNIMRAYARYVLDESAAGRVVLTDEERDLLDAMGYYAELRSYTTHIKVNKDTIVNIPSALSKAPENNNSLNDVFKEMTTVVKK